MNTLAIVAGVCNLALGLAAAALAALALLSATPERRDLVYPIATVALTYLASGVLILRGSRGAALVSAFESALLALMMVYGLAHMDAHHAPQLSTMLTAFLVTCALSLSTSIVARPRPVAS